MVSPAIATVVKMLESLPEETQSQAAEHLREWLANLEDESAWDQSLAKTSKKLYRAAREAQRQIADGKAEPMDFSKL